MTVELIGLLGEPQVRLYANGMGYVDVETTSLQRGIELSRCDHYGFFLPQPLRWYSALPVGMFYAQRVKAGEINFSIDTFS